MMGLVLRGVSGEGWGEVVEGIVFIYRENKGYCTKIG
jgi:hypothetical protein